MEPERTGEPVMHDTASRDTGTVATLPAAPEPLVGEPIDILTLRRPWRYRGRHRGHPDAPAAVHGKHER
jgi:hypothetical protein